MRRRRLAAELRRLRAEAGLSIEDIAGKLKWPGSKVSRIENRQVGVSPRDLRKLLDLYDVEDHDYPYDARVVYVDNDPIVSIHARALIPDDGSTTFLLEDVRNTADILDHPDTRRLIDFGEPVAVLYISFLHQIPDSDDPAALVRLMMDHLAPGSFLALSHLVSPDPELRARLTDLMLNATRGDWGRVRNRSEVDRLLGDLEVIPPGLVEVTTWRPDETATEEQTYDWIEYGGVARK